MNLTPPVLGKGEDHVWSELEEKGYSLAFEDESLINGNQHADIGDGALIFMTVYFNKPEAVSLPYEITASDNYEEVFSKIGRKEDDDCTLLSEKSWVFTDDSGLKYILFLPLPKIIKT